MTRLPVVAIIAAYNEADVIGSVVGDLIRQDVSVWLIDHASTDGTVAAVEPYRGRGLLAIERFPATDSFPWASLLRRKEALARELDAAWFVHNDADEFRESPWSGVDLRAAIARVDAAGYNAIDSARFDFWPVRGGAEPGPGEDVREVLRLCEPAPVRDRVQIRCWKKQPGAVDLASSGGHEVRFPGRKVFPVRFIVRHYPIRGQRHGERKVFAERRPRFVPAEREQGWHVQYDEIAEGASFLRDPATLGPWEPEAVRLDLMLRHRGLEEMESELARAGAALNACREHAARLVDHHERRLHEVYASRSWRWTAPMRAAFRAMTGRPA